MRIISIILIQFCFSNLGIGQVDLNNRQAKRIPRDPNSIEIIQNLIREGLDVNQIYSSENTLLHYSVYEGNFELVKLLVENGAELNRQNFSLESPLDIAASPDHRNDSIVIYLIEQGADPNTTSYKGFTALRALVGFQGYNQNEFLFNLLIDNGADVNVYCTKCCEASVFMWVVLWGTVEMVQKSIENGADLKHVNCEGLNILMFAIISGDAEKVQMIISTGNDFSGLDNDGNDILDYAIHHKNEVVIEMVKNLHKKENE